MMNSFGVNFDDLKPLREKKQSEYVPSEQEILEYAEYLGVNLPEEDYMLELVKEGITAQLPPQWQACHTPDSQLLYRNLVTREVQEDHPLDQVYRQRVIELRKAYTQYEEDPELRTITEERSEEQSIDMGDGANIPSQQFFEIQPPPRREESSDLNKAVIYSSQRLSEPHISSTLNIFAQDSLSRQKSSGGAKQQDKEMIDLKRELEDLRKQESYSLQLLQEIRINNQEKINKLKRKLAKRRK